jgi:hypothetical protein
MTPRCGAILPMLAALLCGAATVPAAEADPAYTNFIVHDSQSTAVRAINNSGDVTGEFYTESKKHPDRGVGFLRKANGKIATIDYQHAAQFDPKAINDAGEITGKFYHSLDNYVGLSFVISGGTFTAFGVPHAIETDAFTMNNNGVIAGQYFDRKGYHGFVRTPDGVFDTFNIKVEHPIFEFGRLNDNDDLAGDYGTPILPWVGFIRNAAGKMIFIREPKAATGRDQGTQIRSINNSGVVAGQYFDSNNLVHGFVRSADGKFTEFDPPGWAGDTEVSQINNNGDIVGDFVDANRIYHGFLRDSTGKFTIVDGPTDDVDFTFIGGISDSGVIGGSTCHPIVINGIQTDKCVAFVRTP